MNDMRHDSNRLLLVMIRRGLQSTWTTDWYPCWWSVLVYYYFTTTKVPGTIIPYHQQHYGMVPGTVPYL